MEYDFRNRAGQSPYQAQPHVSMYRPTGSVHSSPSSHLYPRLGQPVIPPTGRAPPYQHGSSQPPPPGTGIRVAIKPEYRITPPPQMSHLREVPRSNFQFDFEFERKILAEAEKETQNWSQLGSEIVPPRAAEPVPSVDSTEKLFLLPLHTMEITPQRYKNLSKATPFSRKWASLQTKWLRSC